MTKAMVMYAKDKNEKKYYHSKKTTKLGSSLSQVIMSNNIFQDIPVFKCNVAVVYNVVINNTKPFYYYFFLAHC